MSNDDIRAAVRNAYPDLSNKVDAMSEQLKSGDGQLEMDKLARVGPSFRAIVEFLSWLSKSQVIMLSVASMQVLHETPEQLAASWLGIDYERLLEERAEFIRQYSQDSQDIDKSL